MRFTVPPSQSDEFEEAWMKVRLESRKCDDVAYDVRALFL